MTENGNKIKLNWRRIENLSIANFLKFISSYVNEIKNINIKKIIEKNETL